MKLYLVQHGQALPKAEHPDRPLTDQGRQEVETVAAVLVRGEPRVSRIVHSGKTRARQTAEILADHLTPDQPVVAATGLDPADPVEPWVQTVWGWKENSMLVGHQPFMGKLVSRLVLGEERALVDYQPGTVVCLEQTSTGDWRIVGMFGPALLQRRLPEGTPRYNTPGETVETIGLLGGMSWESTVPYYRIVNETVRECPSGLRSAKIVLARKT